jgi:methylated-DNA-[protein]-cysteine S-methyltransferase
VPLDLLGTPFQCLVWHALQDIPYGVTWTYRELAQRLGRPRALRAVGAANAANPVPIVVPCHRVVAAGGKLGGYTGGLDLKRRLLALESDLLRPPRKSS